jgi:adenylate cyclase
LFEAYYYYGRARFHQGDMQAAADLFEKAAKANPADYQSRLLRVQVLRGMGRKDEALEEAKLSVAAVEKHLEWNPDDARALHLGAGSLVITGDIDRAERWLQRALEIDPNDSVVLYNVACNYATVAQTEKALDYLEQAIEHGTVSASWMKNDEDLVSLHELPRYREMLAKLEQKNYN